MTHAHQSPVRREASIRPGASTDADAPGRPVTLVACYGAKPDAFRAFIVQAQWRLRRELGRAFQRYPVAQVHATIIGMEGEVDGDEVVNANFAREGERRTMQFDRLLEDARRLAFTVRIGGFRAGRAYGVESAGGHPHERSFSVHGDFAVAMGWPVSAGRPSTALDDVRRRLADHGVRHKYHRDADDVDNDFYFVLGRVDRTAVPPERIEAATEVVRDWMASIDPLSLEVDARRLAIVGYRTPELPIATSTILRVAEESVTPDDVRALYRD